MRCQSTLLVTCTALALLVSAVPQGSTSTRMVTKTATGASTALATGRAAAATGVSGSKDFSAGSRTGTDEVANDPSGAGSSLDSSGDSTGSDTVAGSDYGSGSGPGTGVGADTESSSTGIPGADAASAAGSGAESATGDYSNTGSSGADSSDAPGMGDHPSGIAGDGTSPPGNGDGNWKTWMQKWIAGHPNPSQGVRPNHPHQPRSWNNWWSSSSSSDHQTPPPSGSHQGKDKAQAQAQHEAPAKRAWRRPGDQAQPPPNASRRWLDPPHISYYAHGENSKNSHSMHQARDVVSDSGPSWNDMLGHVSRQQQLARRSLSV